MSQRKVHIVVWMLLIASGVFFALTYIEHREQQQANHQMEQLERGLLLSFPFQSEKLLSSLSPISRMEPVEHDRILQTDYTAFVLLSPTVCTGCILETHEWLSLLKDFEGGAVSPALVILENDSTAAHSFYQKTQFSEAAFWGQNELTARVTEITQNIPPIGQLLVFVDNRKNQIIRRYIIPSRVTNLNTKQILLDQVFPHSTVNLNK